MSKRQTDIKTENVRWRKLFVVMLAGVALTQAPASGATTFAHAKQKLYRNVYGGSGETFYANCYWAGKRVDLDGCGLLHAFAKKHRKRAARTEVEHIIPASWLLKVNGQYRPCATAAKEKGKSARKYCRQHDKQYQRAHNDLVNLRVAIGQINAERGNKPFAEKPSGSRQAVYRGRERAITISSRTVVPAPEIRGDIARIAMYMRTTYHVRYSRRQLQLFAQWRTQDPVSVAEYRLNQRIKEVQGWGNPFVLGAASAD